MDIIEEYKKKFRFITEYKPENGGNLTDWEDEQNGYNKDYITLEEIKDLLKKYHYAPLYEIYNSSNMGGVDILTEKSLQKILDYHIEDNSRACVVISAQRGSWTDDKEGEKYGYSEVLLKDLSQKYKFQILPKEDKSHIEQLKNRYSELVNKYHHNDPLLLKIREKLEKDKQINNYKTKELKQDINLARFSYMPVYGGFVENKGTQNEQLIFENSFLVFNIKANSNHDWLSPDDLFKWGVTMIQSNKYNQDSFLYKKGKEPPVYINKEGEIDNSVIFTGEHQIDNYAAQYFTQLKKFKPKKNDNGIYSDKFGGKNKRVTFTTNENKIFIGFFGNPSWSTINEHRMRYAGGEIHSLDKIYN